MPHVLNLPALVTDGRQPPLTRAGVWESATDLNGLANALRIGVDTARVADIKSVPDAWAQAQVFAQALLDPTHGLHADARAQWRGLLALLALQPEYKTVYDLRSKPLRVRDHGEPEQRFRKVLADLLPRRAVASAAADWREVDLIYFVERRAGARAFASQAAGTAVGLTSPVILVCPGKAAASFSHPQLPWARQGLGDPTKVEGVTPRQYQIIAEYLGSVGAALGKQRGRDTRVFNDLIAQLRGFHDDCLELAGDVTAFLKPESIGLNAGQALYAPLDQSQVFDADKLPPGYSHCRLALRDDLVAGLKAAGRGELFKGVVLVDPAMATPSRPAESIVVWKNYSLRDAASPTTLARMRQEIANDGYLLLEPDELFTRTLVQFADGVDVPGAGRRGFEATLMPFSPVVLLLLRPEQLAAAAELSSKGGQAVATLQLPLLEPDGARGQTRHTLTRTFAAGDIKEDDPPEDLALWPNFRSSDWRWNFMHFQYNPELELQTRFGASAELIAGQVIAAATGAADRALRLRAWSNPDTLELEQQLFADRETALAGATAAEPLLHRLRYHQDPALVAEVHRYPAGVEAVFFARFDDASRSARPVGMVLVRYAPFDQTYAGETQVAVDFGTTNTVAYQKRGASLAPISFEDRLVFPVQMTRNQAERRGNLTTPYTNFFPLRRHATPFPTVVKRREFRGDLDEALKGELEKGHPAHGFSDSIFFVPEFAAANVADRFFDWAERRILIFNIKWARDPASRQLTKRFLRQLMMMTAAELKAMGAQPRAITWSFSHPQSFSKRELTDLRSFVSQAWQELFGGDAAAAERHLLWQTESAAAASYFLRDEQQQAQPGRLMLMLDIGGGTTDVALWNDGQMIWRDSFKIAGRDFFTRYLANNPEVLEKINFKQVASKLNRETGELSSNFIELFVNSPDFNRNFEQNYPAISSTAPGEGLRWCAAVALGGILYYVGLVLARLRTMRKADGTPVVDERDLRRLTLAMAGRGSALFRPMNTGDDKYDTELANLAKLTLAAANVDVNVVRTDAMFSKEPKHEVARGLLSTGAPLDRDLQQVQPVGEVVRFDSREGEREAGATDDLALLLAARDVRDVELVELRKFLVGLRKLTGIAVQLDGAGGVGLDDLQSRTGKRLRDGLRGLAGAPVDTETQELEPPFITALSSLVEMMSRPVARRDAVLAVSEA